MRIPVYVINLKRSVERRNHTYSQLNDLGIKFSFIEAVDGNEFSDMEIIKSNDFDVWKCGARSRNLLKGEIGCVLSHLKIYKKIIDEEIEMACILEDDNDYEKEFRDVIENIDLESFKWELLYLGHNSQIPLSSTKEAQSRNKMKTILPNYYIGIPVEVPFGSYAYIIKREAAVKLLANAYPIKMPIDIYMGQAYSFGIHSYLLSPPCATNNSSLGSIIFYDNFKFTYDSNFTEGLEAAWKKIKSWFPFLINVRKWLRIGYYFPLIFLRKSGLLKNPFTI
jgi:glycosyl transferase family 25